MRALVVGEMERVRVGGSILATGQVALFASWRDREMGGDEIRASSRGMRFAREDGGQTKTKATMNPVTMTLRKKESLQVPHVVKSIC